VVGRVAVKAQSATRARPISSSGFRSSAGSCGGPERATTDAVGPNAGSGSGPWTQHRHDHRPSRGSGDEAVDETPTTWVLQDPPEPGKLLSDGGHLHYGTEKGRRLGT